MTDRLRLGAASVFDGLERSVEHGARDRLVGRQHRTLGHVVEAAVVRVGELQHDSAAEDGAAVFLHDPEVLKAGGGSELRPPGRLHEPGLGRRRQQAIPCLPPVRCRWGGGHVSCPLRSKLHARAAPKTRPEPDSTHDPAVNGRAPGPGR